MNYTTATRPHIMDEYINNTESSYHNVYGIYNLTLGITLLTTDILIIILNFVTILVISKFRHKNAIDIFVFTLAVADFVKGLIPVPMSTYIYLTGWYLKQDSIECKFFGWIAFATNSGAMLILTLMSVERFWAVTNPFSYKRYVTVNKVKIVSIIAMLFTSLHSVLPVLGIGRMLPYNHGAYSHFDYSRYSNGTIAYSLFIICYGYGMLFIVMLMYSFVFYKIRNLIHRHRRMSLHRNSKDRKGKGNDSSSGLNLKTEKMFSYLTVALMILFMIGWLPFLMVVLASQLKQKPPHAKLDLYAIRIAVINSLLNPIAYAALCKPYRRGILYYFRVLGSYAGFKKPDSDIWDPWRRRRATVRQYERKRSDVSSDPRYVSISEYNQSSFTDSVYTNNTDYGRHRLPSKLETYDSFRRKSSAENAANQLLKVPPSNNRLPTVNESRGGSCMNTLEREGNKKEERNSVRFQDDVNTSDKEIETTTQTTTQCDLPPKETAEQSSDNDSDQLSDTEQLGDTTIDETPDQRRKLQLLDRVQKYLGPKREEADKRIEYENNEEDELLNNEQINTNKNKNSNKPSLNDSDDDVSDLVHEDDTTFLDDNQSDDINLQQNINS